MYGVIFIDSGRGVGLWAREPVCPWAHGSMGPWARGPVGLWVAIARPWLWGSGSATLALGKRKRDLGFEWKLASPQLCT